MKRSKGLTVIGWLIIISNIIYLSPILHSFTFTRTVSDILGSRYILPPSLSFNLIPIKLLNIFPPTSLVATLLISAFFLFIGVCILRLVNFARLVVIVMSSVLILEQVVRIANSSSFPDRAILGWVIIFVSIIAHSAYIYYLTRPKVREQFK